MPIGTYAQGPGVSFTSGPSSGSGAAGARSTSYVAGGRPMGFQVGEGGNVANAYGKGIAAFSGPTVNYAPKLTTKDGEGNFVSKGELAYLSALANYNAGVQGWGLGKAAPGNVYGMTPGLTGVPGFIGGQSTSWGQFLSNVMKMVLTGGTPTGILGAIGMNMAQSGQLGEGAQSIAAKVGSPTTFAGNLAAKSLGLPGGYVAPQVGGIASLSGSGITGSQQIAPSQVAPPSRVAPPSTPTSTTLSPGPTTDPSTFLADAQQLSVSAGIPIQQAIISLATSRGIDPNQFFNIPAGGIGSIGPA